MAALSRDEIKATIVPGRGGSRALASIDVQIEFVGARRRASSGTSLHPERIFHVLKMLEVPVLKVEAGNVGWIRQITEILEGELVTSRITDIAANSSISKRRLDAVVDPHGLFEPLSGRTAADAAGGEPGPAKYGPDRGPTTNTRCAGTVNADRGSVECDHRIDRGFDLSKMAFPVPSSRLLATCHLPA